MSRNLAKTLTFACLHFLVGFSVTFAFTGSLAIAGGVAIVEPLINTLVFYLHELGWQRARSPASSSRGAASWIPFNRPYSHSC